MSRYLKFLAVKFVDLVDPFLSVSAEFQPYLRQQEQKLVTRAVIAFPMVLTFVHLNALLLNDAGKTNYSDWLRYRLVSIGTCLGFAILGYVSRLRINRTRIVLLLFGISVVAIFAFGMTLGYKFRSQWMSYFSAPIFATALRSPLMASVVLAGGLAAFKPIWGQYHETRLVMTEYEFTCLFIFAAFFWRKLWIDKVIADVSLRSAEARAILQQQELHNQLRTFVPPVLVHRIESLHKTGSSIVHALDSVLRLRRSKIAVLYSDLRNYSRRSDDLEFVSKIVIPSASNIIDQVESNGAVAKVIGDGIFSFYSDQDPEESILRALRDAWMCAEDEFVDSQSKSDFSFSRHFTVTFGEAYVGNIGSKAHKDMSVIGRPANMASRIDGLTKNEHVAGFIGKRPHVLLSSDARNSLIGIAPDLHIEDFSLTSHGIEIRSYEAESAIHLLPLDEKNLFIFGKLLSINNLPTLKRKINGKENRRPTL